MDQYTSLICVAAWLLAGLISWRIDHLIIQRFKREHPFEYELARIEVDGPLEGFPSIMMHVIFGPFALAMACVQLYDLLTEKD